MKENNTDTISLSDKQKQLIEDLGVLHEQSGFQPSHARILSLLLVSPETELSFDEIRGTLQLSKSATSNAINMLLNMNKLEYLTKPGERKRYFRNKVATWKTDITKSFKQMAIMAETLEEALKQRPGDTTEFNSNLRDVIDFIRFLNEKLPTLYHEWEQKK